MENNDENTVIADITRWYTGPETAKIFGVSPQRVGQMRKEGKVAGVQRGKGFFYSQETIDRYLASRQRH
jgi:hypothetical protein